MTVWTAVLYLDSVINLSNEVNGFRGRMVVDMGVFSHLHLAYEILYPSSFSLHKSPLVAFVISYFLFHIFFSSSVRFSRMPGLYCNSYETVDRASNADDSSYDDGNVPRFTFTSPLELRHWLGDCWVLQFFLWTKYWGVITGAIAYSGGHFRCLGSGCNYGLNTMWKIRCAVLMKPPV